MEVRQDDKGWSDLDSDQYGGESALDEKMGSDDDASQGMRFRTYYLRMYARWKVALFKLFMLFKSINNSIPKPMDH